MKDENDVEIIENKGDGTPVETPQGEQAPAHRFAAVLSQEYPERQFGGAEDYDAALEEMLTGLVAFRQKSSDANRILAELFDANPELGLVVKDMMDGATLREALARHIDKDDLIPVEGDPDYEGWNKNKSERLSAMEARKKRQEEFDSNLEFSASAIREFASENNMTEEQAANFLAPFDDMLAEINSGKMTKETLSKLKRVVDFDEAVKAAREEGLMAGRNENITAKRESAPKGDGLPHISGSGGTNTNARKSEWIDDVVNHANSGKVL